MTEKDYRVNRLMTLTRLGYFNRPCSAEVDRERVLSLLEGILSAD